MEEFKLLLELNKIHVNLIAEAVIKELKQFTDKDFLLSGDDSGLKNVWEEICVQKQDEESFYWDAYENTIENCIEAEFKKQQEPVKILIRYVGSMGSNDFSNEEDYEGCDEEAIGEIKKAVIEKATDYQNNNIVDYLNKKDDDQEED